MGRHRQSHELAKVNGAARNHPERYRNVPPKSQHPLGTAPKHLDAKERAAWAELAKHAPKGVLVGSDRAMVEVASVLIAQFRGEKHGIASAKLGCLISTLAKLGLSPTARQSLGVAPGNASFNDDDFSDF